MKVNIKKLHKDAIVPTYARAWDAGADLYADGDSLILAGKWEAIPTGIAIEIPAGYVGLIHPRSGMAAQYDLKNYPFHQRQWKAEMARQFSYPPPLRVDPLIFQVLIHTVR